MSQDTDALIKQLRSLGYYGFGESRSAHDYFSHSGGRTSLREASDFYDEAVRLAREAAAALKAAQVPEELRKLSEATKTVRISEWELQRELVRPCYESSDAYSPSWNGYVTPLSQFVVRSMDFVRSLLASEPKAGELCPGCREVIFQDRRTPQGACGWCGFNPTTGQGGFVPASAPAPASPGYECEDCIGMKEHGCYCMAMGASRPGGPGDAVAPLRAALAREEIYLTEAVRNADNEDGPGIMPGDVEGSFARIREAAALNAETELAAMTERCRVLQEALKPFAAFAEAGSFAQLPGDMLMTLGSSLARQQVTASHFRRAAAVLSQAEKGAP